MIFYLLGLLSYYKLANKPVPASICLLFFGVVSVPPAITLFFLVNKHWTFQFLAFAGGLFCWTFIEYFIHRFLMHSHEKEDCASMAAGDDRPVAPVSRGKPRSSLPLHAGTGKYAA